MNGAVPAGWYPEGGRLRWWNGVEWTGHTAPLPQTRHEYRPTPTTAAPSVVVVRDRHRSVTRQRKNTSHTFHLLMTVFTAGAWGLFVWLPLAFWHAVGPRRRVVTRYR